MAVSDPQAERLDAAMVLRGLTRSRTHAARLIADGVVLVGGRPVTKASHKVVGSDTIEVTAVDDWVSRGALKLLAALDSFAVDPAGRLALDAGASTGGFTQVLLARGAGRVIAVDVGHGQLAGELALDPRVDSHEGVNVRELDADGLARLTGSSERPSLVVADLSFISLRQVLAPLASIAADGADLIVLVKPQFEVGRVKQGVVRNAGLRADALAGVLWAAWDAGLGTLGVISSPIAGSAGNLEYLVHLRASGGSNPTEWEARLPGIAGA
ncbi:TlyA family RNA methyltransferase [Herbiconiux sp. L3-i23]|uniref:TlyA family RNA methyltransferase n=1 Tax=Herbiconiux sp. L3-i23 TaxID=2905871 RepID=UPI002070D0D4|nr:TlyA family RNA methyltransferase [Herbiconiux sp. L3-i23]BDI22262.1 TlyA family rRNA (cytidine-2'-O)-methyltransferase [Herbiconiux sp. L3-i23]